MRRRIGRGQLTVVVALVTLAMFTGVGAPAGRADGVVHPEQPGALKVAVRASEPIPLEEDLRGPEGTVREVAADFYFPAHPGPWPVVVFSPGTCDTKANFTNWGPPLASRGFVVVVPNRRMALAQLGQNEADLRQCLAQDPRINSEDLLRVLAWVAGEAATNRDSFLYRKVDPHHLGIVGHSLGGTFAALAAARFSNPHYFQDPDPDGLENATPWERDYRGEMTLRAVVLLDPGRYWAVPEKWAPEYAARSISTPTVVLAARRAAPPPDPMAPKYSDIFTPIVCEASAEHSQCLLVPRATYAALSDSVPKLGLEVVGATHFEPADPDGVDSDLDADTLSFHPRTGTERQLLFRRYSMAWLGFWLRCDGTALPFLDGRAAEADQADGKIILFDRNTSFPLDSLPAGHRC